MSFEELPIPSMQSTTTLKECWFDVVRDTTVVPVFSCGPDNDERLPAVILVHEIFGVNDHIKDVCRRFARLQMRVYAPDLFVRSELFPKQPEARSDLTTMREVWQSIPDSDLISDLRSVMKHVRTHDRVNAEGIGTIGYCMGGAIAFMFACESPELAWCVDYYGRIKYQALTKTKPQHPITFAKGLKCPFLGIYAGIDDLIPPEDIQRLMDLLSSLSKSHQIKVFEDVPHAFFNDQRENYRKEAADAAWQLTVGFINRSLLYAVQ